MTEERENLEHFHYKALKATANLNRYIFRVKDQKLKAVAINVIIFINDLRLNGFVSIIAISRADNPSGTLPHGWFFLATYIIFASNHIESIHILFFFFNK